MQEEQERKKKAINDSSAKKEKAIAEMNKVNNQILQKRILDRKADEQERKAQRDIAQREKTHQILVKAKEAKKKEKEMQEERKKEFDAKLEKDFQKDKENRKKVMERGDEAAMRERENEKLMVQQLAATEDSIVAKIASKEAQLKMKQEKAMMRAERIQEQKARKIEEEK